MFPWVATLIGNTARGVRRKFMIASALAALAVPIAASASVDYANLRRTEARTQDALAAAARGAAIAYGNGLARSQAEARDVGRQIFRSDAPSAATADPSALSVEMRPRGAGARWDGALDTPLRTCLHLGPARVELTASAEAPAKGRVVGVAGLGRADRL